MSKKLSSLPKPIHPDGIQCCVCLYWDTYDHVQAFPVSACCRRHAPAPPAMAHTWWPQTEADDWCGDGKRRPAHVDEYEQKRQRRRAASA